jgi:hypothetical protein
MGSGFLRLLCWYRPRSALALLVVGICLADDADDTATLDDLAVHADATDAAADFHGSC